MAAPPRTPCFSLAGRVALVTGSSTGLDKAVARCLGLAGAKVAFDDAHARDRAERTLADFRAEARGLEEGGPRWYTVTRRWRT